MKTPMTDIVNLGYIAKMENPIKLNEILPLAEGEGFVSAKRATEKVMFLGIDLQNDFMEGGPLGVDGSIADMERLLTFLYNNADKITNFSVTIDTHQPHQVFHPSYWVDYDGNHPDEYTKITVQDYVDGKWRPLFYPFETLNYLKDLEANNRQPLTIWPYHCINGTRGHALEGQFSNMLYYLSVARKAPVTVINKGQDPKSEMYGAMRSESSTGTFNIRFLDMLAKYDKIVIAGQAKSHCVLTTIEQIIEYFNDPTTLSKIYILEDCMSNIAGCEAMSDAKYTEFRDKHHMNLVKSTDKFLD